MEIKLSMEDLQNEGLMLALKDLGQGFNAPVLCGSTTPFLTKETEPVQGHPVGAWVPQQETVLAPKTTVEEVPTVTLAELRKKMIDYVAEHGQEKGRGILALFNATTMSKLDPKDYASVFEKLVA